MKQIKLNHGLVTLVDDDMYKELNKWKWCAHLNKTTNYYYASRTQWINGKKEYISMHRVITSAGKKDHVDHVNHDTLNNQKNNLRICSGSENQMNRKKHKHRKNENCSSIYKGVTWSKNRNSWQGQIGINGVVKYLGLYAAEKDAAYAYDTAASILFKKFALFNNVSLTEESEKNIKNIIKCKLGVIL